MEIKKTLKTWIINVIPDVIKNAISYSALQDINVSYAQEGEDIILNRFLAYQHKGFYVDIGAHHPTRFSNTYLFYKKGWSGINIDAMPGSMAEFQKLRPRDINIEIPISAKKQELKYFVFNEPALNTFSPSKAKAVAELENYELINSIDIETFPLSDVLDQYLPPAQGIDFLTIDAEGLDFEVLTSNNWDKYQPKIILIESTMTSLENIEENQIYLYLKQLGYSLIAKTYNTFFFKKD